MSWTSWRRGQKPSTDRGPRTSLPSGSKAALTHIQVSELVTWLQPGTDALKQTLWPGVIRKRFRLVWISFMQLHQSEEQKLEHCWIWESSCSKCKISPFPRYSQCTLVAGLCYLLYLQAEGQNAKNQQMDPFTRRQCKPTMVSNVRVLE